MGKWGKDLRISVRLQAQHKSSTCCACHGSSRDLPAWLADLCSMPVLGTDGGSSSIRSLRLWEGQRQMLGFVQEGKYNPYWEYILKSMS